MPDQTPNIIQRLLDACKAEGCEAAALYTGTHYLMAEFPEARMLRACKLAPKQMQRALTAQEITSHLLADNDVTICFTLANKREWDRVNNVILVLDQRHLTVSWYEGTPLFERAIRTFVNSLASTEVN